MIKEYEDYCYYENEDYDELDEFDLLYWKSEGYDELELELDNETWSNLGFSIE